jgi:hypothetical protein
MIRDSFITVCKINLYLLLGWRAAMDVRTKQGLFGLWNTHCILMMLDKLWNQYSNYYTWNTAATSNGTYCEGLYNYGLILNTRSHNNFKTQKSFLQTCVSQLFSLTPLLPSSTQPQYGNGENGGVHRATLQFSQLCPVSQHWHKSAGRHPYWWDSFWWPFFIQFCDILKLTSL